MARVAATTCKDAPTVAPAATLSDKCTKGAPVLRMRGAAAALDATAALLLGGLPTAAMLAPTPWLVFCTTVTQRTNLLYKMHSTKQIQKYCIQFNHHICPFGVTEKTL